MRRFLATLVIAGGCLGAAAAAHAAPVVLVPVAAVPGAFVPAVIAPGVAIAPGIVLVEGGCGPYGFRDRFGYCRSRRFVPQPRFYGCRPGTHPTPYGCRPNY